MTQLSPSILAADFANLKADCCKVLSLGADMLHFDVMDGHFVPNISFGVPVLQGLKKAVPDAFYDVHLMISHPLDYIDAFAKAGASCITFHIESESDPQQTIDAIHAAGCKAGISVKPATPVSVLLPFLPQVELVLIMSVEPGFGGQSFMPEAATKIAQVKTACATLGVSPWIEVDGGITPETAPLCTQAGANLLVAGSAVFGAADVAGVISQLKAL